MLTYRFRKPQIRISSVSLSGDGSFVDVRYWLSRPDKAQGRFPVYLVNEATKEKLGLMRFTKHGAIRTRHGRHQAGGVMLFFNRNGSVRSGSSVTLFFGPLRAGNIKVI